MLQQIRAFLAHTPFEPFQIITSAGTTYRVEHPENCAIIASRVVAALPDGKNVIAMSPLHIASVIGVEEAAA